MNKNDWRYERFQKAKEDEAFVGSALTYVIGGGTSGSTFKQDTKEHIDLLWDSPKRGVIGIDVKGVKANKTKKHDFDDSINWLELKNVQGKDGWLKGKAEYIAFRTFTDVIFVKRTKLLNFIEEKIQGKELVYKTPTEYYIPYQRRAWKLQDIVVKVPTSDIRALADFTINNIWYSDICSNKE